MEFLWAPPEQAGWLDKERHTGQGWDRRFFILKGQVLFYFKSRTATSAAKLRGAIPLESAKIETEAPAAPAAGAQRRGRPQHVVTITLHASNALNCRHNFYTLAAPSAEVQAAWVTALWQAAIPRSELINSLQQAGRLPELVARYAEAVQQCYPVADAAVISAGGSRAKLSFLGNLGALAGAVRRARAKGDSILYLTPQLRGRKAEAGQQGAQESGRRLLPAALQDPVAAAQQLARTASGTPMALAAPAASPPPGLAPVRTRAEAAPAGSLPAPAAVLPPAAAAAPAPPVRAASLPHQPMAPPAPTAAAKLPPGRLHQPDTPTASAVRGAASVPPANTPSAALSTAPSIASTLAGLSLPRGMSLDSLATANLAQLDDLLLALTPKAAGLAAAQAPAPLGAAAQHPEQEKATTTARPASGATGSGGSIKWADNPLAGASAASSARSSEAAAAPAPSKPDATVRMAAPASPPAKPAGRPAGISGIPSPGAVPSPKSPAGVSGIPGPSAIPRSPATAAKPARI